MNERTKTESSKSRPNHGNKLWDEYNEYKSVYLHGLYLLSYGAVKSALRRTKDQTLVI